MQLLTAAAILFDGTVAPRPLGPLADGTHEVRGVAAAGFTLGYFASPLDVHVSHNSGHRSYFLNLGVKGEIVASRGGDDLVLDTTTAAVFNPSDHQYLRPVRGNTEFLGLRIDAHLIHEEISALACTTVDSTVLFDFAVDLTGKQKGVGLLVASLVEQFDTGDPLFRRPEIQRGQLRTLVSALLLTQPHSQTGALRGGAAARHPRALRTALAWIDANLTETITLGDIARAGACSARTISTAFRERLGTSPMAYVRDLRLDRIRADLLAGCDSVTTAASRWGITHLSRFAESYRRRFGELPSSTVARR